jgi:CBS domain-containing protein
MRRNEPVTHVMTKNPDAVQLGQPVSAIRRLMSDNGYHHVPVLDGKKLVGIVTGSDLLRVSFGAGAGDAQTFDAALDYTFKTKDVMKANPVSLDETSTVRDAADVLSQGLFHSLPVVNDGGELVGIVTSTDLMKYLLAQY